jgi:hypothetical protein
MKARLVCLVSAIALLPCLSTAADQKEAAGRYLAKALKGDYYVYGGSIGDSTPPTEKDRKLSLMLIGPLAKDLFDHIGPDAKNACGADADHRHRYKGDLTCIWAKTDGYSCYFGLNVQTGKSMSGLIC